LLTLRTVPVEYVAVRHLSPDEGKFLIFFVGNDEAMCEPVAGCSLVGFFQEPQLLFVLPASSQQSGKHGKLRSKADACKRYRGFLVCQPQLASQRIRFEEISVLEIKPPQR
jgi:hypothetical protein